MNLKWLLAKEQKHGLPKLLVLTITMMILFWNQKMM
jgi:hypothetical protein